MPLKFYIAPFRFYSKQGEDYNYRNLVIKALNEWQRASAGKFSFVIVQALSASQINLEWKRVERKALGHCYFHLDAQNRLYSAEVQIGISDGIIHQGYMEEGEVYHTILHEIGHALGLGHSPFQGDIMYTPHEYGIVKLSGNDRLSLHWLYRFNPGDTPSDVISKHALAASDLDSAVLKLMEKNTPSEFEKVKSSLTATQKQKDLLEEQENIADLKKYNLALQNIKISEDMRKFFINPPLKS